MKHEATVRQFFEDLERLDFEKVAGYCAADCAYEDVPVGEAATAVGPDAIRAKLEGAFVGVERLATTIHEIAESGDTVLVERTEVWHHATGEQVALPVMAVFHFRADQIVLWRDYWDMKTLFENQPAAWLQRMAEAGASS
jgi:limonene-1,2-epoxide hydrolase